MTILQPKGPNLSCQKICFKKQRGAVTTSRVVLRDWVKVRWPQYNSMTSIGGFVTETFSLNKTLLAQLRTHASRWRWTVAISRLFIFISTQLENSITTSVYFLRNAKTHTQRLNVWSTYLHLSSINRTTCRIDVVVHRPFIYLSSHNPIFLLQGTWKH